mgnify:CR=1 FL=1
MANNIKNMKSNATKNDIQRYYLGCVDQVGHEGNPGHSQPRDHQQPADGCHPQRQG